MAADPKVRSRATEVTMQGKAVTSRNSPADSSAPRVSHGQGCPLVPGSSQPFPKSDYAARFPDALSFPLPSPPPPASDGPQVLGALLSSLTHTPSPCSSSSHPASPGLSDSLHPRLLDTESLSTTNGPLGGTPPLHLTLEKLRSWRANHEGEHPSHTPPLPRAQTGENQAGFTSSPARSGGLRQIQTQFKR